MSERITGKVREYIEENSFCSEYLFMDCMPFLDLLYSEGCRVTSVLWWDRCETAGQKESLGTGGYIDPDDPTHMYAETQLYDDGLEKMTLDELKEYISSIRSKHPGHSLFPSFYLSDRRDVFREESIAITETDGGTVITDGESEYRLTCNPREPDLNIIAEDGRETTVHNAFTVEELTEHAVNRKPMRMITGNEYDTGTVCGLILLAVSLGRDCIDIDYLEGCRFLEILRENGAVSAETAFDLAPAGLRNHRMMETFIHSGKVRRTGKDLYYLAVS